MITLKNVRKEYRLGDEVWEMKDISFEIQSNEFVVITGISGAGKSTLLHLIGGLDFPEEGEILVGKKSILRLDDQSLSKYRNKTMGFVFQNFYLYPDIDIVDNVALPLLIAGVSYEKRRKMAKEALDKVSLSGLYNHAVNQISGGQRQRVAIARALVHNPHILLADEPTGNLDTHTGKAILSLLVELQKKEKMILIIVTHDQYVAKEADRLIELKDGRIVRNVKNHHSIHV